MNFNCYTSLIKSKTKILCVIVIHLIFDVKLFVIYSHFALQVHYESNFVPDRLIVIFNKTTEMENIVLLAKKYNLPLGFTVELFEKIIDKENFEPALQMFMSGAMTYEIAIGKESINVKELQNEVLKSLLK